MIEKPAQVSRPIHELMARRWSPRAFDPTRAVAAQDLIALLEAARWAPSCFNAQPWRYLVWDRQRDAASWQRAFACLSEGNQAWVKDVPVLMLSCADSIFEYNQKPNRWGQHDTGAASENLCLQALTLGLAAHQMGGFDADRARTEFSIPERYECMAMIAIGYPAAAQELDAEVREKELSPRERQAVGEFAFLGSWATPLAAAD